MVQLLAQITTGSYSYLYLFLSLVYPPLFLYTSLSIQIDAYLFLSLCQSKFTAISFKPVSFIFVYSSHIHLHSFLSLIQPPLFLYTSLSIQIDANLLLYLCQSQFTVISFKTVFFRSVYCLYIHLYLFLSLFYPTLFLYTSLLIRIDTYLFLSLYQSKFTAISFKPDSFIFVYPSYIHLYLFLSLIHPPLFLYASLSIRIAFYPFVIPNSRLSLSIPFPLSLSILYISTYICFYLLSMQLYFFIHLC